MAQVTTILTRADLAFGGLRFEVGGLRQNNSKLKAESRRSAGFLEGSKGRKRS
jgi:hypothetical protein